MASGKSDLSVRAVKAAGAFVELFELYKLGLCASSRLIQVR